MSMSITTDELRVRVAEGIALLGGPGAAARRIGISDRTIRHILSGQRGISVTFTRRLAAALREHKNRCGIVEKGIDPLFLANIPAPPNFV